MRLETILAQKKSEIVRDAGIKRFEFTFELSWKTTKLFLLEYYGTTVNSPKACFRELCRNKLLTDIDAEKCLTMTDDRNEIIHSYDENFSKRLFQKIRTKYYPLMKKLYHLIKK